MSLLLFVIRKLRGFRCSGTGHEPEIEDTPIGPQYMMPGISPVRLKERLAYLQSLPWTPKKPQKPCDIGLFDEESRRQLELF